MLWLLDLKPKAQSLCSSNLSAYFTQGAPNRKWKVPTIDAQSMPKEAEENFFKVRCFGCPWVFSTARGVNFKIILHRIISVVWLTNFLSEIRSLSNHDDETQFRILSVKPIWSFSAFDHWWSLTVQIRAVMDGEQSEWPSCTTKAIRHIYLHLSSTSMATQGGAVSQLFCLFSPFLVDEQERI